MHLREKVGDLQRLEILDVHHKRIWNLPIEIGQLTNLIRVNLEEKT